MPLPLNLAMTSSEIAAVQSLPARIAWMACHFSTVSTDLEDLPGQLPEGSMLILDDSIPCRDHSASRIARQLFEVVEQFKCDSVLLDFQRPKNKNTAAVAAAVAGQLPCPVGITPHYAGALPCAIFLPPAPLHVPLKRHLLPWKKREIWLEAALTQELITVTQDGAVFHDDISPELLSGGFFSEKLCCRYVTVIQPELISFTLFDTQESLTAKLAQAHSLGVTRAVGLYQELGGMK